MLAVAMNGAALPTEHGFPARMWCRACTATCRPASGGGHRGDDLRRGAGLLGAARLVAAGADQDRVPDRRARAGRRGEGGQRDVAGVAWAQHKGIEAVEVRIDGGPWHEASWPPCRASTPGGSGPGSGTPQGELPIEARATDKTGLHADLAGADVGPNGASGYPSTQVTII